MMPGQEKVTLSRAARGHTNWRKNGGHAVMPTRGDWKLWANGCRGASWKDECFWSQQLVDGNSAKRTPAFWMS